MAVKYFSSIIEIDKYYRNSVGSDLNPPGDYRLFFDDGSEKHFRLFPDAILWEEIEYKPEGSKVCFHEWKSYQGFNENYDYCILCDGKR